MERFSRVWLAVMLACMLFTLLRSFTEREHVVSYELCVDGVRYDGENININAKY